MAASDAELLIHLYQDVDAGVVTQAEIDVLFKGGADWPKMIRLSEAIKKKGARAFLRLLDPVPAPEQAEEPTPEATAAGTGPRRVSKAVYDRIRMKKP